MASIKEEYLIEAFAKLNIDPAVIKTAIDSAYEKQKSEKVECGGKKAKPQYLVVTHGSDEEAFIIKKLPTNYDDDARTPKYRDEWGDLEIDTILEAASEAYKNTKACKRKGQLTCFADIPECIPSSLLKSYGVQFIKKLPVALIDTSPDIAFASEVSLKDVFASMDIKTPKDIGNIKDSKLIND